jgi:hypothetical protein
VAAAGDDTRRDLQKLGILLEWLKKSQDFMNDRSNYELKKTLTWCQMAGITPAGIYVRYRKNGVLPGSIFPQGGQDSKIIMLSESVILKEGKRDAVAILPENWRLHC